MGPRRSRRTPLAPAAPGASAVLDEREAIQVFALRARDVRGELSHGPEEPHERETVLSIVRLLGCNKVAVLLAAGRADFETPAETLAALTMLGELPSPDPELRRALIEGDAQRRAGRLAQAEKTLKDVAARATASGDRFAEAEARRLLGAVVRATGRLRESLALRERALATYAALGDRANVAVASGEVGASLASFGRLREARTFHERAIAVHRELGRRREEGVEWSYLGVTLHRAGRFAEAKRAHERALDMHRETRNIRGEGADRMHLGYVLHELGELAEGRASYEAALKIFRRIEERSLEGVTLSYLGALEIEARRPEDAGALLEQARAIHREVKSPRHEAVTSLHLAQHHFVLGEPRAGVQHAKRALSIVARADDAHDDCLELEHRAWAEALAGRLGSSSPPVVAIEDDVTSEAIAILALAARVRARKMPANAGRVAALEARGLGAVTIGSRKRFAIAALEGELHAVLPALVVAADGTAFLSESGKRVDLGRRVPLVLILRHLLQRRLVAAGEPQPPTALLEAGWPGERVLHEPGQLRVRNALAQLRKLGLAHAIVTRGGGYLIDPSLPVRTAL